MVGNKTTSGNLSREIPSTIRYLLQIFVILSLSVTARSECGFSSCQRTFSDSTAELERGPNRPFCEAATKFKECVSDIPEDSCRGNLFYHSAKTAFEDLIESNNCETVLRNNPPNRVNDTPSESLDSNRRKGNANCVFQGTTNFRHCGLFGDPHLRTFEDKFLTCKAAGAWLLIYNNFLAVQVTNMPLIHGNGATATTRLSVVIQPFKRCTPRRLYEVNSGSLPNHFIDGTRSSGSVRIVEVVPFEHVEIHVEHIATVMIIRQIGKYITFAVKMPEQLIQTQGENDIQLCVKGCPYGQKIQYTDFLTKTEKVDKNFVALRDDAVAKCRKANVIDVYLDSCVFDLLTTGDSNFTRAAQSALSDVKRTHPHAYSLLVNRTSIFEDEQVVWQLTYGNSAPSRTFLRGVIPIQFILILLISVYFNFSFKTYVNR